MVCAAVRQGDGREGDIRAGRLPVRVVSPGVSRPAAGHGNLGKAMRRIGSPMGRGPNDPGATRLVDRIVTSRRVPWRHLQHAIARLRACEQAPPSWTELVDDLTRWHDRKARIAYKWAVDFHAPYETGRKTTQKGSSS
ncbi:type I-E CRISPR-associated protein Cse2/CasB [Streptomyces sp. CA-181903]|uniref:type I-E CRISPR-associated protein Cse2/CasB n=1 Tax=Streptomyces sp. CA-181903 TaxID=3240055 RepID=UPI003D93C162